LYADAIAYANGGRIYAIELDHHLYIAAARLEELHAANILDDSGKHLRS